MILPSLAITAGSIAVYYRLFRSDLISTLQEDFITMARSKGLSTRWIMWRHAFRPSSFSLLAAAGVNIGALIAGTFIVEYLFALNGLGYSLVQAVEPARLPGGPGHHPGRRHRLRGAPVHHRLHLHHGRSEGDAGVTDA